MKYKNFSRLVIDNVLEPAGQPISLLTWIFLNAFSPYFKVRGFLAGFLIKFKINTLINMIIKIFYDQLSYVIMALMCGIVISRSLIMLASV